jgi:AcrR family transcriptional regulator
MAHAASRGPGRPPAAKAAETRKRIVGAAREVFSELGYEAATFQAIADRADLTRPAINHYFSSKRALFREVVAQTNDLIIAASIERARAENTFLGQLFAFITVAVETAAEDRSAAAFLVSAVLESHRRPELRLVHPDSALHSRKFLTGMIDDAIERGEISTDSEVAPIVEMLFAVLWGVGFYAGYVGNQQQLEALCDNLRLLLANKLWQFHR